MDIFTIFLLICYKKRNIPTNGIYENNIVLGEFRNKNYNIIQTLSMKKYQ